MVLPARCIVCNRFIWRWSDSGWYVTAAGVFLRWHARCVKPRS